jgi:deazaflavin-dependent oxidoreductase (nitroreductase family)
MPGAYVPHGFLLSRVVNPVIMRLGLLPTLAVRGRRSGEWRTVPVHVLELDGDRYLVAPRGDTHWARNLRASGTGELRRRGRRERFRAVEVPPEQRRPLIDAYLSRWGREVKAIFEQLPDPQDHPVFRLLPAA